MTRPTPSRVIGMWTRTLLDELAPGWRTTASPVTEGLTDPAALRVAGPYIPHEDMVLLWSRLTDTHADPLFGIRFAERHANRSVGLYAYAAAHAPDFGTAARACIQVQRLIDTHADVTMEQLDGGVIIYHRPPAAIGRWPRHLTLSLAAGCVHLGRSFTGVTLAPREVRVQHAEGPDDGARWFGCPIRYEQPSNALVFDQATLDLPLLDADVTQFNAILTAATRTLEQVAPPDGLLDQARVRLRTLGGKPSIGELARALGMSERTLQRRLGELGTTFRHLLDEIRVESLASHSLTDQKGRATASALGFSDPSSLRRLRKRWKRGTRPPR